jgi:monoamine oxidase
MADARLFAHLRRHSGSGNLEAMGRWTRRSFLAASAALAASPALGQPKQKKAAPRPDVPRSGIDVVVVGAGAAGIAAARRIMATGHKVLLFEASDRIGGRCFTETTTFGVPYDRGARWIRTPEANPVAKLAAAAGLDIYPAPPGQRMRIGRRYARESEMEDLLAALVRANTAIAEVARKSDTACSAALPKTLGEWRPTIEFMLGPFASGHDLSGLSTVDFTRSAPRDVDAFCRQGLGALIATLAKGLPVKLSSPVTRINYGGRFLIEVEAANEKIDCRSVIVTASTNVLAAGKINFSPALPARKLDAASKLRLGSYDRVALELPGNPLGLRTDELVFEKSTGRRTAAILGNLSGTTLCTVDVAGEFGRQLSAKGQTEMVAFALDWLANLYGANLKRVVGRAHATRWNNEPWVLGAMSAAAPGAQWARRVMMESVNDRVWFAGEAAHETLWGTVGGAWASGERAASLALARIAGGPAPKAKR